MKKFITFLCTLLPLLLCVSLSASAATASEFTWGKFDKGYVTIVFDDGRSCTSSVADLFKEYNMPLSCAIVGKSVEEGNSYLIETLTDIQNHGGEILSHTYTHTAFDENTTLEDIEYEFSKSYEALTNAGFVVNGIIEAGSGGDEKKVDYELVQQVSERYYKYSNAYGTSLQYKSERISMSGLSLQQLKAKVSRAAEKNEWLILYAHDFNEISRKDLELLLQHIEQTANIKTVTYKYMYETFGNYANHQFGDTYYTVSFADADNSIFEEKVVAAGSTIVPVPDNPPENTVWEQTEIVVQDNITVTALPETDSPDDNPLFSRVIIGLVVIAGASLLVFILALIKKLKTKPKSK